VPLGDSSPTDRELCVNVKDGLPFCMDMIRSDLVIRSIETYYHGSALKPLSPSAAKGAWLAVRRTAHNPIDDRPLTLPDARNADDPFCRSLLNCPEGAGSRRPERPRRL
jgi:hypothetical protein